jgi:two-component system sensor histidine kinase CiaH
MNLQSLKHFFRSTTARLALSYLAIIMLMSIGFSIVYYNASWHELGRYIPPPSSFGIRHYEDYHGPGPSIDEFYEQRITESRHTLLTRLGLLNLLALLSGSLISYYLARRTLEPIEANMDAQNQFVSDASHELRTPLTALQTTNEVALRKNKLSQPDVKDILGHNVAEVIKLRLLTDSLLKLAKVDNGGPALKPVFLNEVVADAINAEIAAAMSKNITIDDTVPKIEALADKPSLTQALTTILDNAIKYSPKNSKVQITAAKHAKHALLTVKDEGTGIKADQLPHIFDRFYRADASRNKQKEDGFGIGLALAKKIIDQHGGEIIAVSTEGKGSIFTIKLPLA